MTHEEYIDAIKALQESMLEAVGSIETLELTKEERTVVDALPDDKKKLIDSLLSKYQAGPVDVRRRMVEKGIAILILKGGPTLRKAWKLGEKAGVEIG